MTIRLTSPLRRIRHGSLAALLCVAGAALGWAAPTAEVAAPSRKLTMDLPLAGGRITAVDGIVDKTLKLPRGAEVELRWRSDRPIALHFHGYDIERKVTPVAPATMRFKTTIPGRFPVSEHLAGGGHRENAVLYIEVQP